MQTTLEPTSGDDGNKARRTLIRWALLIACAVFVAITFAGPDHSLSTGSVGPPLSLMTPDGEPVDLRAHTDKPLFLNFFATWCAPCRDEIPELNHAHETNKDVNIAGVLIFSGTAAEARNELKTMGIKYPVWISDDVTAERWRVSAVPASYLMDQRGIIRWSTNGGVDAEDVASAFKKIPR